MKTAHVHSLVALTVVGVVAIVAYSLSTLHRVNARPSISVQQNSSTTLSSKYVIKGRPTKVIIPALALENKLETGVYDAKTHTWSLSQVNAHYAEQSAPANLEGGNVFVYGHNSKNIFGRLNQMVLGQEAILETTNQLRFYYQLASISEVQPSDVWALDYSGPPILTIQTCTGNWNEKRQMFRFNLKRVEVPYGSL